MQRSLLLPAREGSGTRDAFQELVMGDALITENAFYNNLMVLCAQRLLTPPMQLLISRLAI